MAGALVIMFLLNHSPDFKRMLNQSVLSNQIDGFVQTCNPAVTDPIIHAIRKKIQLKIMSAESIRDAAKQSLNETRQTISEMINVPESDLKDVDKSLNDIDISECDTKMVNANDVNRKENQTIFPKSAPFLVAIIESLSNITAQTCGGTLLSPHWVLTAADCVNLLHNLYGNGSNVIETSRYTVVINSTNPLIDGTVYNVTQVHLHPYPVPDIVKHLAYELKSQRRRRWLSSGPNLAILRVEPAVDSDTVEVAHRDIGKDEDMMVYGWAMIKNDTGFDSVRAASFSATVSSLPSDSADESSPVLRLSIKNANYSGTLKMSSGGPVVVRRAGRVELVAVVQADEGMVLAYPLYEHWSWIEKVLRNK